MRRRALLAAIQIESSIPNNEIRYTSSDGNIVEPNITNVFGANITSNTYSNGKGVITFDDSVTTIGEDAFRNCTSLTSVTIPNSVTTIGNWAFYSCSRLTRVYCRATTPPTLGGLSVFAYNGGGRKIYVPVSSVNAYRSATRWKEYASDIVGYNF